MPILNLKIDLEKRIIIDSYCEITNEDIIIPVESEEE